MTGMKKNKGYVSEFKGRKLVNKRYSNGVYASESHTVAGMRGRVITRAHYYTSGKDGIYDGSSMEMMITNKNVRRAFNNAIFNGAMKFLGENYNFTKYGDYDKDRSWHYKLIQWKIIYVSTKKFYIYHKPENLGNRTMIVYGSRKARKDVRFYNTDNFSPKRQKTGIYAKQRHLYSKYQEDDKYISKEDYDGQFKHRRKKR